MAHEKAVPESKETESDEVKAHPVKFLEGAAKMAERKHGGKHGKKHEMKRGGK